MKTQNNANAVRTKKPLLLLAIAAAVIVGVVVLVMALANQKPANYAEEVAKPLETSLSKVGAVKNCSRGNPGVDSSSTTPSYYAIYEVPGNRPEAVERVKQAAKESGFDLQAELPDINREDNAFFVDKTSKLSTYSDLQAGAIALSVTAFGSSTYTGEGDQFCTVTKRNSPPTDKTTIRFTVNLPEYKR